ncbi:MAG: EAL domain-containing protein [Actinomycetota bacterium]|nr:EAL domain-containing protein [Actinomycetota bacterium]MDQ3574250.1 EAL domain-containing protein [Actinomycetota bacterium]
MVAASLALASLARPGAALGAALLGVGLSALGSRFKGSRTKGSTVGFSDDKGGPLAVAPGLVPPGFVEPGASEPVIRAVVERLPDVVMIVDEDGWIRYASPATTRLLGRPSNWLTGHPLAALVHADDRAKLADLCAVTAAEDGDWPRYDQADLRLSNLHGQWVEFDAVATSLSHDPDAGGVLVTLRDVSQRKTFEEELRTLALHDPLTNLANRALFADHVRHALARYRLTDARPHVVLLVDLDGFKAINDSLGHAAGDQVLVEFADRLRAMVRPGDTAARLGGDEFAVLLENSSLRGAAVFARELLDCVRGPVTLAGMVALHGQEVFLTGSAGVALSEPGQDAGELLRNADVAMYAAKTAGKDRFEVFQPEMQEAALRRLDLETALRGAIDQEELVLHYQPIVALDTGELTAVEALVRWHHPERGLILPAEFIPVAEASGLIKPLGVWVLEQACRQVRSWQQRFPQRAGLRVSVNASPVQIEDPKFLDEAVGCLRRSGLAPEHLTLEITESLFMEDFATIAEKLRRLKALGVQFAMDDFGTGFSSLSYLRTLPIDEVKIDKAFIDGVTGSSDQSALVTAVIQMAHTFGLLTVAEGIEREDQLVALQMLGGDLGQGYLFSRPLDAPGMEAIWEEADRQRTVSSGAVPAPSALTTAPAGGAEWLHYRSRRDDRHPVGAGPARPREGGPGS